MKTKNWILFFSLPFFLGACDDPDEHGGSDSYSDTDDYEETLDAPAGISATPDGNTVVVKWESVSGAARYEVHKSRNPYAFAVETTVSGTRYTDRPASPGNYYYKVAAVDYEGNKGPFSDVASCYFTGEGGSGQDEEPDDDPEDEVRRPSAPTGVRAENYGNAMLPEIRVSWNEVSSATSYKVYRGRSASGTYSLLGTTATTHLSDFNPEQGANYYKVKAVNSAGESDYSSYAVYNFDPSSDLKPCPVEYTNCTAGSTTMTLRWRVSTSSGCGKPDRAYLRVRNPESGVYADVQTLSGTATSASFSYLPWVDENGYVYVGIILENEAGTSGGVPKVYDTNSGRWIN